MTCTKCGIHSSTLNTAGLCEACNTTPINYDGGPAFPTPIAGCTDGSVYSTIEKHAGQNGGMTLRDWFAGMALQGMYASDRTDWNGQNDKPNRASKAYEMADAMLEARKAAKHG